MINGSFESGIFPDEMKHAVVRPILKKAGLDAMDLKSWRPISNLSFTSKLAERIATSRLRNHLSEQQLLPETQSAYRQFHSTETALTAVVDKIVKAIDAGQVCALVLLDLSAAFDTIDHDILFDVLDKRFGVQDGAMNWIRSYFSGRTQTICTDSDRSSRRSLLFGVPQGSVAGPVTFICYTEDVQDVITVWNIYNHTYADDNQLLACTPVAEVDTCRNDIERCVLSVQTGCMARRLQLNPEKTELIWFGSRFQLQKLHASTNSSIYIGGIGVKAVEYVRDLGVILDNQLSMRKHVSQVVSTCFFHLRRLRQLRARLSREQRQRLVSSIILSRVDYCNVVLAGLPASSLAPLQRVLNAAARFVADLYPCDHVTGTLRDLHWFPIRTRITYKLCTLMHASVHGAAPVYIRNMLTSVTELPGRSHLRSAASGLYDVPRTRTKFGTRSFSVAGPTAWNALPLELRATADSACFRKQMKTFLFIQVYGTDPN